VLLEPLLRLDELLLLLLLPPLPSPLGTRCMRRHTRTRRRCAFREAVFTAETAAGGSPAGGGGASEKLPAGGASDRGVPSDGASVHSDEIESESTSRSVPSMMNFRPFSSPPFGTKVPLTGMATKGPTSNKA